MQTLDGLYLREQTWPLIVFTQQPNWRNATADACKDAKEKQWLDIRDFVETEGSKASDLVL